MNASRTVHNANQHKSPMARMPVQSTFQASPMGIQGMQGSVLNRGPVMGQSSLNQMLSPSRVAGTPMRTVPVNNHSGYVVQNNSMVQHSNQQSTQQG